MKCLLMKFHIILEDKRVFDHFLGNKIQHRMLLELMKQNNMILQGKQDRYFELCYLSMILRHILFAKLSQLDTYIQYYINLKQGRALYFLQDKNIRLNRVLLELPDQLWHNKTLEGIEGNQLNLQLLEEADMFQLGKQQEQMLIFGSSSLLDKHLLFKFLNQQVLRQLFLLCNSIQIYRHLKQQQGDLNDNMNLQYIDFQQQTLKDNNVLLYITLQSSQTQ